MFQQRVKFFKYIEVPEVLRKPSKELFDEKDVKLELLNKSSTNNTKKVCKFIIVVNYIIVVINL